MARNTFEMLSACDVTWAGSFLEFQKTNIFYTEYDGLHLFRRPLVDGCIRYGPEDYRSTEPGHVAELISRGSLLEVHGKLQREGDVQHVIAQRLINLSALLGELVVASRNFH